MKRLAMILLAAAIAMSPVYAVAVEHQSYVYYPHENYATLGSETYGVIRYYNDPPIPEAHVWSHHYSTGVYKHTLTGSGYNTYSVKTEDTHDIVVDAPWPGVKGFHMWYYGTCWPCTTETTAGYI